jgi:glucose/mannose-6-phosphate isomerase
MAGKMLRNLDSSDSYSELDQSGMGRRLYDLGEQCRAACIQIQKMPLVWNGTPISSVLVAGMGGSAVGGDLLSDLLMSQGTSLHVSAWRDYGLPSWVGPGVLVIACSYSGTTEETLSAFKAAIDRGAAVIAITSGGELAALARHNQVPTITIPYDGEPRTALGYTFLALLPLLTRLGLTQDFSPDLTRSFLMLEELADRYSPSTPKTKNLAKSLAHRLVHRTPTIYSSGFLSSVARIWKLGFNENAKTWATTDLLPELQHNTVMGYQFPPGTKDQSFVLLLHSTHFAERILKRYQLTTELLEEAQILCEVVQAEGQCPLSHMLSLTYLGMWTSYYLGILYGVDPSTTPSIDVLKRRLAASRGQDLSL